MVAPLSQNPHALVLFAAAYAAEHHRNQRRKGAEARPYINHPLQVAQMLAETAGVTDPEVLAAALLHDTVEDTDVTIEDIEEVFGHTVASFVAEVTDDKSLEKADRKRLQIEHAAHLSPEAGLIKIADKTINVLDVVVDPPAHWPHSRAVAYLDWAEAVVGGLVNPNEALLARFQEAIQDGRASLQSSKKDGRAIE